MADEIEHAVVRISPDFTGFKTEFNAKLKAATAGASFNVKVGQITGLKSALVTASSRSGGLKIRITEVTGLQAAVNRAARQAGGIKVNISADTTRLNAQLARLAAKEIKIKVKYDVDRSALSAVPSGGRSRNVGDDGGGSSGGGGSSSLFAFLGGGGNRLQGKILASLTTVVTPLTGALLGLASAAAVASSGIGIFAASAVGHIAQLTDVMKQVSDEGRTLDSLPAPFQRLIPVLQNFQKSWGKFLSDTRGPVFDVFIKGLTIAQQGLQKFTPIVNAVAGAIDKALTVVADFADGPAVRNFLQVVQTQAPAAIVSLTRSAANLGSGLLDIFTAFAPAGQSMLRTIEQLTARFRDWAASLKGSEAFQNFLNYAQEYGPKVLEILTNLLVTIGKVIVGLAPLGAVVVEVLNAFTKLLSVIPPPVWTAISVAVAAFYTQLAALLIVGKVSAAFQGFMAVLAGFRLAVGLSGGAMAGLQASFSAFAASTAGMGTFIAAGVIGITALTRAARDLAKVDAPNLPALQKNMEEFAKSGQVSGELLRTVGKDFSQFTKDAERALNPNWSDKIDNSFKAFSHIDTRGKSLTEMQDRLEGLDKAIQGMVTSGHMDAAVANWNALKDALTKAGYSDDQINKLLPESTALLSAIGPAASGAAEDLTTLTSKLQQYQAALAGSPEKQIGQDFLTKRDSWIKASEAVQKSQLAEKRVAKDTARAEKQAAEQVASARERLSDVIKQTAQDNVAADKRVQDAQYEAAQAARDTRRATEDLTRARRDAAQQLADLADQEEAANLQLLRAQRDAAEIGLFKGNVASEEEINRREIALRLSEAQKNAQRTQDEATQARRAGVEGAPGVLQAKEALAEAVRAQQQADAAVVSAYTAQTETYAASARARRDAQKEVNDAIENQRITFENGKQARDDAYQATQDAIAAESVAKAAYDESRVTVEALYGAMGIASDKRKALGDLFGQAMTMNVGNVPGQLRSIQTYMEALRLLSGDANLDVGKAWKMAGANVSAAEASARPNSDYGDALPAGLRGPTPSAIAQRAKGGPVFGQGSKTSDSIPALLSNNEHVWTADEVQAVGGHSNMKKMRNAVMGKYAGGGPVMSLDHWDVGGRMTKQPGFLNKALSTLGFMSAKAEDGSGVSAAVGAIQEWLKSSVDPLPYVFGAVGPNAYDCSGLVGEVWARLTGHKSNKRYFVTGNEREFLSNAGFVDGPGTFTVGFSAGHTMGNLAGLNFEAANSRSGIHVGGGTTNVLKFPNVMHLPQIGGQFIGSDGASLVSLPALMQFPGGDYYRPNAFGTTTGGDPGKAGGSAKDYANSQLAKFGWGGDQWASLERLWQRESSWNPNAVNKSSGAYGIPQALPSAQGHPYELGDYASQINWGLRYIANRYGSPNAAWAHEQAQNWYAKGGAVLADNGHVVADNGATLPPMSRTVVDNKTNKHERVGFGMSEKEQYQFARIVAYLLTQALQTQPNVLTVDREVVARKVVRPTVLQELSLPGVRR